LGKKIARLIFTLAGAGVGAALVMAVDSILVSLGYMSMYEAMYTWGVALVYVATGLLFAIIFFLISPKLIAIIGALEHSLSEMAVVDIFFSTIGLMAGLIIAFLASTLTSRIRVPVVGFVLSVLLYVVFGYLGWSVMLRHRGELKGPAWLGRRTGEPGSARDKILDTSVIIDGRIADICATGVLEGNIIVPAFVVQELQHIADSADSLKRNRGRRGLDILRGMQEAGSPAITVLDKDYEDISEVDSKLLKLAGDRGGVVVTNDYNLNKVAALHNVPVFNINDLANALKPIALPGEEMRIPLVKEGKEQGQAVGYMEDGTMIVVDNARKLLGETVDVTVTSVLQTSAGRMIFARLR